MSILLIYGMMNIKMNKKQEEEQKQFPRGVAPDKITKVTPPSILTPVIGLEINGLSSYKFLVRDLKEVIEQCESLYPRKQNWLQKLFKKKER